MKKIIILCLLTTLSCVAFSQSGYTNINSRYNWLAGIFKALGLPSGDNATFQTGQAVRAGAVFYDSTGADSGLYVYSGLSWKKVEATDTTSLSNRIDAKIGVAANGLTKSGDTVMLGGPLGTPASLSGQRVINLNDKTFYFIKNNASNPIAGTPGSTPLYGEFIDSLNQNNPSEAQLPTAATSWARILRMTGNYSYGYKVGHAVTMHYEFGDTARVISNGGDFGGALYNKLSFGYLPSFTTGRSAIRGGVVSYESAYAGASIIEFASSNANRHIKYNGWVAAHNAVLRMTNFPDTIENFIFYNAHSYKEASAKVLKSYGLYMNGVPSDSAWTVYSPHVANRFYQSGKAVFGLGGFSSDYQLKVTNNTQLDSLTTASRLAQSDTTGYDIVMRDRTTGLHKHIRADQLGVGGGGGSPGIDDVLAQGQALTADRTLDAAIYNFLNTGSEGYYKVLRSNGTDSTRIYSDKDSVSIELDNTTGVAARAFVKLIKPSGYSELLASSDETTLWSQVTNLISTTGVWVTAPKITLSGTRNVVNNLTTVTDTSAYWMVVQRKVTDGANPAGQLYRAHWPAGAGASGGIDTIYRKPGQDSIFYEKGGNEYAIKDSVGGGSSEDTWTIGLMTLSNATTTDGATQYFGNFPAVWHTSPTAYPITILKDCTLVGALIDGQASTAGTGEEWSMYVRVNNTTDHLIEAVSESGNRRTWNNNSLNVSLSAGDQVVIKSVNPTWDTNPATIIFSGYLMFKN